MIINLRAGAKGNKNIGLTNLGEELVNKLVDRKIAIDLSHANEKTFYDITSICKKLKEEGKDPIVFASHSNCFNLCNNKRNLKDKQIVEIKDLEGVIGIVEVKNFCINEERINNNRPKYYNSYIDHIKYVKKLLKGVDNICVSTDDMRYYKTNKRYYKNFNVFKHENMKKELEHLLFIRGFTGYEIEKILYKNFNDKILQRI